MEKEFGPPISRRGGLLTLSVKIPGVCELFTRELDSTERLIHPGADAGPLERARSPV